MTTATRRITEGDVEAAAVKRWRVSRAIVVSYRDGETRWLSLGILRTAHAELEVIGRRRTYAELLGLIEQRATPDVKQPRRPKPAQHKG